MQLKIEGLADPPLIPVSSPILEIATFPLFIKLQLEMVGFSWPPLP